MKRWFKRLIILLVIAAIVCGGVFWYTSRSKGPAEVFQTAEITKGPLESTIAATGTLEPEEVVDVGAQISGQIVEFGKDAKGKTIDYGSVVEKGAMIAKIDDSLYQAAMAEAEANVLSAKAGVQLSEANLQQLKAKLLCAYRDWERAKKLGPSEALAQSSYDAYEAAYESAKANVAVGEATILQNKASLTQAEKSLWRAKRNLEYCTINAPVTGTVLDRRVSIGQTVASSMSTPSLFLIAKDLRRMRLWVSVNEADIAKVYLGQAVTFTVDALPEETFDGQVCLIRPNASMTQNVVTYTVEIATDNSAGRLRPYLTANARFIVDRRDDAMSVPAEALTWMPDENQIAPEFRGKAIVNSQQSPSAGEQADADHRHRERENGAKSRPAADAASAASQPTSTPTGPIKTAPTPGIIWVQQDQYVKPVAIMAGLTDGVNTEIVSPDISEGMKVVIGMQSAEEAAEASDAANPFMPKFPSRGKKTAGTVNAPTQSPKTKASNSGSSGGPPPGPPPG